MSNYTKGGQRRTIHCGCGFIAVGGIREANFKMKMHSRLMHSDSYVPAAYDAGTNGINGIKGNCYTPLKLTEMNIDGESIDVSGLTVKDAAKLLELYKLLKISDAASP
jgi:hypothetical protein